MKKKAEFKKGDKVLINQTIKGIVVEVCYTQDKYFYRCNPLDDIPTDIKKQCGIVDFKDIYRPASMLSRL